VEKDTILLADFENRTGDAIFDGTLKQGLAIQLQQSPFLNIFSEALALCGETGQARALIEELGKRYPEDTIVNGVWLPVIRAAIDLQRGNAAQAIDQLQAASRYEAAAEFWPQHLRGQAFLKLGRGAEAAAEFQKILDHRGYAPLSPLYPLAHLGLARAAALTGDRAKSQKAWDDLFAAWKEADPDLPVLIEAKREDEKR
jgi:predicted Zn-dependent protease